MIAWTQKLGSSGSPMPRPPSGETPIQHVRIDADDWQSLGQLVGFRKRAAVIRDLLRWYLRRPGARLPERPSQEDVIEVERQRILGNWDD